MSDIETALEQYKARTETMAMEALQEIFHRIPFGTEVLFANGQRGVIKEFYNPKTDEEGRIRAGIDIAAKDGSWHIEFTLEKSGWGAAPGALGGGPVNPPTALTESD